MDVRDSRVAAVTGASRGLGAAFARVLSEEGFAVALGARDVEAVTGGSYTASKFALRALTRTFQQENPDLRVLELRPGAVDTSFAGSTPGAPGKEWFLQPEVVAEAVRFALRLPDGARVEEIVLRSRLQTPEY